MPSSTTGRPANLTYGTDSYIEFMRPRCEQLARILKPTGSLYYHCDWHASHYVRMMLDQIFGEQFFRSEIIWKRNHAKSLASKSYPNNHDNIYYYADPDSCKWNRPFLPYDLDDIDEKTAKEYRFRDADGRAYCLAPILNPNHDRPNLTYEFLGVKRVWRWTKERMQAAYEAGQIVQTRPGAVPKQKYYLDERAGRTIDDVWIDIQNLNNQTTERQGYPTQKPLSLLDRIIKTSSDPDDIVLDAFCGCGTALVAAQDLGRRWIGIDISPTACRVMSDRLEEDCKLRLNRDFVVRDMPHTEQFLRKLPPFEFENWAVVALGGTPNKAKDGDHGIDGRIYFYCNRFFVPLLVRPYMLTCVGDTHTARSFRDVSPGSPRSPGPLGRRHRLSRGRPRLRRPSDRLPPTLSPEVLSHRAA